MAQRTTAGEVLLAARGLRIALFTETFLPRIDGTVTRLTHTVRQLQALGHEVLVIAPEGGIEEFHGARIYGVPGFPFPLYPELKVSPPRPSIGRALAEFRPHLIHASQPVVLGASAFHYSSACRVPLVISYHAQLAKWLHYYRLGFLEPALWWSIRSAYNRADLVLATSDVMRVLLLDHGFRRVELWQRGVDTDFFRPENASKTMREELTQGHPQDNLLLYVGRLSAEKDIEACRPVLEAIPGLRLALAGDGPNRRKLEQHFAGMPAYFAGYLSGSKLAAAYASADVFFLPSRTETLGLVVLEAMAAGCPVVAAAEGGILDVIQDGVTGHLYRPQDLSGAIAGIRLLLEDPSHREAIRRSARREAEKWGWRAATQQLVSFYREILAREQQLSRQLARERSVRDSPEAVCEALQISRATLNRLLSAPAPSDTSG